MWLIVSHFLTWYEVLHPPLYKMWGPMSCEINLWRQVGQHGLQGPCQGLGRGTSDTRKSSGSSPSLPFWCQDSAHSPQLQLKWTLLWGPSPVLQLEPCLDPARWNLELLIYLLVSHILRVRSKLAGQCPQTSCVLKG